MVKIAQAKRPLDCAHFPLLLAEITYSYSNLHLSLKYRSSIYEPQNITKEKFRELGFLGNSKITADEYGAVFWDDENILILVQ